MGRVSSAWRKIASIIAFAFALSGAVVVGQPGLVSGAPVGTLFELGDMVWFEQDGVPGFTTDDAPVVGANVLLFAPDGTLLDATVTSDGSGTFAGTYLFSGLPAGEYYVRIPAGDFGGGGPLEGFLATTLGFTPDPDSPGDPLPNDNDDIDHHAYDDAGGARTSPISLSFVPAPPPALPGDIVGQEPLLDNTYGLPVGPYDDFDNLTLDLAFVGPAGIDVQKEVCATGTGCDISGNWVEDQVFLPGSTVDWQITVSNVGAQVLNSVAVFDGSEPACEAAWGAYVTDVLLGDDSLNPGQSETFICTTTPLEFELAPNTAGAYGFGAVTGEYVEAQDDAAAFIFGGGIGDVVWFDYNRDGWQDGDEPGINLVTVSLTPLNLESGSPWYGPDGESGGGDDVPFPSQSTNPDGFYFFGGLPPGEYQVDLDPGTLDPAFFPTWDWDGGEDRTAFVGLNPGEEIWDVDFGESVNYALGDRIWIEQDGFPGFGDGPGGDAPAPEGVRVVLWAADGSYITETGTDGNGYYLFTDLNQGDYWVQIPGDQFDGGMPLEGLFAAGVGYVDDPNTDIEDTIDHHAYDGDGVQTNTITLAVGFPNEFAGNQLDETVGEPTDDNAYFDGGATGVESEFDNLTLDLALSGSAMLEVYKEVCSNGQLDPPPAPPDLCDPDAAIGEGGWVEEQSFFFGSRVQWRITLVNTSTQVLDDVTVIDGQVPACDRNLVTILPGETVRYVCDTIPLEWNIEPNWVDVNATSAVTGEEVGASDGATARLFTSGIGDRVWWDADRDGGQGDPGSEPGINEVTVRLTPFPDSADPAWFGPDGEFGTLDDVEPFERTTSNDGNYFFDHIPPGEYFVELLDGTLDPAFFPTWDWDGGDDRTAFVGVGPDEQNWDVDFGESVDFALGDLVWIEQDGDPWYSFSDGLVPPGTEVQLYRENGEYLWSEHTNDDGRFLFTGLAAGNYFLRIPGYLFDGGQPLEGYFASPIGLGDPNFPDDDWFDHNAFDGDGVETGIVTLSAWLDPQTGVLFGEEPFVDNGYWGSGDTGVDTEFDNLTVDLAVAAGPGLEIHKEVCSWGGPDVPGQCDPQAPLGEGGWVEEQSFLPGSQVLWRITVRNTGAQWILNAAVTDAAVPDCDNTNIGEFGMFLASGAQVSYTCVTDSLIENIEPNTAEVTGTSLVTDEQLFASDDATARLFDSGIGDRVWWDVDRDYGQADPGSEPGINGVIVQLTPAPGTVDPAWFGPDGVEGTADDLSLLPQYTQRVTSVDGEYFFGNIPPGEYIVELIGDSIDPAFEPTYDWDFGEDRMAFVGVGPGEQNWDVDFGEWTDFALGDVAWIEQDGQPGFTFGDVPVPEGTEVQLYREDGEYLASSFTDPGGFYLFTDLNAGRYFVRIPGYQFGEGQPLEGYFASWVGQEGDVDNVDTNHVGGPGDHNAFDGDGVETPVVTLSATLSSDFGSQLTGDEPTFDRDPDGPPFDTFVEDEFDNLTIDLALQGHPSIDVEKEICSTATWNGWPGDPCDPGAPLGEGGWVDEQAFFIGTPVLWRITLINNGAVDLTGVFLIDNPETQCSIPDIGFLPVIGQPQTFLCLSEPLVDPIDPNSAYVQGVSVINPDEIVGDEDSAHAQLFSGELGDRVWYDVNQNGAQDPGEPGIGGVDVMLTPLDLQPGSPWFGPDGTPGTDDDIFGPDGAPGGGDDLYQFVVTTAGDGHYLFGNLPEGPYEVSLDEDTLDDDFFPTYDFDNGMDRMAFWWLGNGGQFHELDFGESVNFALGNLVWIDIDGDDLYTDGVDILVPDNTEVELWNADNTWTGLTATTSGGAYLFEPLPAGDYYVVLPAGQPGLDGMLASPNPEVDPNTDEDDIDDHNAVAGTLGAVQTGILSLGDVWLTGVPDFQIVGLEPLDETIHAGVAPVVLDEYANLTLDLALALPAEIEIVKEVCEVETDCEPDAPIGDGGWVESSTFDFTSTVTWRITITNTGWQDLENVAVSDALVPSCDNWIGDMPYGGDPVTYPCETSYILVSIDPNTAVVDGQGKVNDEPVSDDDTAAALVPAPDPGIDIEKYVSEFPPPPELPAIGADADSAPGLLVNPDGGMLFFEYVVVNTSADGLPLLNVIVTDDHIPDGDIVCDAPREVPDTPGDNVIDGPLPPEMPFKCISVVPVDMPVGQYTNLGTAEGTPEHDPTGVSIEDSDPTNAFGPEAGIEIVKSVQTLFDANTPTGPVVAEGTTVRWTYEVSNTGNVELDAPLVIDDNGTAAVPADDFVPAFVGGDTDGDGRIDPDETWMFEAFGTAAAGQYANIAMALGIAVDPVDQRPIPFIPDPATDDDPAHYFGATPSIDIEKYVNGDEADSADGPFIEAGATAEFTFRVTNDGNVPVTNVELNDSDFGVIPCPLTELGVGESMDCVFTTTAVVGAHDNLGEVTARGPNTSDANGLEVPGTEVADEDAAFYFGSAPSIDIEKFVQTAYDADLPDGPLVAEGGDVRWTFEVTNDGNVALIDIVVTDPSVGPVTCPETELDPGSTMVCDPIDAIASAGEQDNLATVVGTAPDTLPPSEPGTTPVLDEGAVVTDEDAAHYFGADPAIEVEKYVQTYDADNPFDPANVFPDDAQGAVPVAEGDAVVYRYVVTNTGNVPLTNVKVVDDQITVDLDIACDVNGNNLIGLLMPGGSSECFYVITADGVDHDEGLTNTATVTGKGPATVGPTDEVVPGEDVDDADDANFFVALPDIDIEKYVQTTFDADTPTGPLVSVNDNGTDDNIVRFRYVVTNTGNHDLRDVTVTDDEIADDSLIICSYEGDADDNVIAGALRPGGEFTCWIDQIAVGGQYDNTGTVVATPEPTYDAEGIAVPMDDVTDSDDANYFGADPSIEIVKKTQTIDHTEGPGVLVTTGETVRWTYDVTNTGNVPLTNVIVTDDVLVDDLSEIDCTYLADTGDNVIASLPAGAGFACEAAGVAEASTSYPGSGYENTGSVVGTPPVTWGVDGQGDDLGSPGDDDLRIQPDVTSDEPDFYYGVDLDLEYASYVQTFDADDPMPVYDPADVYPVNPDGAVPIAAGDAVAWLWEVANTGNYDLVDVTITVDELPGGGLVELVDADLDCTYGSDTGDNVIALLPAGATATCTADSTAIAGPFSSVGAVEATGPTTVDENGDPVDPEVVTVDDPANYFGLEPSIDIEKLVNGVDADSSPLITSPNEALTWSYVVTNTGNVELTNVVVSDNRGVAVDCGEGTDNTIADLAIGEVVTCIGTGQAPALGPYDNVGTVSGESPPTYDAVGVEVPGETVFDDDPATVFTAVPGIDIEKYVVTDVDNNADTAPGPSLNVGSLASWKFVVTNTGNVSLSDVAVTDAALQALGVDIVCGGAGTLGIGSRLTCTATGIVPDEGLFKNTAEVTADPDFGLPAVSDTDVAYYTGVLEGGFGDILPATGGSSDPMLRLAITMIAAGALLVLIGWRRRRIAPGRMV